METTGPQQMQRRRSRDVVEQLRLHKLVAVSWIADAGLIAAIAWQAGSGYLAALVYLGIGLPSTAIGSFLIKRSYSERFADPTLSYPLLMVAVCNQCIGLWLAPEFGVFFLMNIFQVFAYGLLALDLRRLRTLIALAAGIAAAPIMTSDQPISFPLDSWGGRLLLLLSFVLCLARFAGVVAYVTNLRQRVAAKKSELAESEARFRALTELSSDWYWEQDTALRFTHVATGNRQHGQHQEALVGKRLWESGFTVELEGGWDAYRGLVASGAEFRDVVMKRTTLDKREFFVSVSGSPMLAPDGSCTGYRGVAKEITEKRLAEQHIQYLATHDALTGLPNRAMLAEMTTHAIQGARRHQRRFAVLFIDLDGFKRINDSLGHEAGDALLKEIALRFRHCLRGSDTVARLGGDEFVVIANELESPAQSAAVAAKLVEAACAPLDLCGMACQVSASIGIALYPDDGADEAGLLKHADSAMYLAKQAGKNNFRFHATPSATTEAPC